MKTNLFIQHIKLGNTLLYFGMLIALFFVVFLALNSDRFLFDGLVIMLIGLNNYFEWSVLTTNNTFPLYTIVYKGNGA